MLSCAPRAHAHAGVPWLVVATAPYGHLLHVANLHSRVHDPRLLRRIRHATGDLDVAAQLCTTRKNAKTLCSERNATDNELPHARARTRGTEPMKALSSDDLPLPTAPTTMTSSPRLTSIVTSCSVGGACAESHQHSRGCG